MASKTTTFPVSKPVELIAKVGHGTISVVARDDLSEAVVELSPRDGRDDVLERMTVELRGSTLSVSGPHHGGGLADLFGLWRRDRESIDARIEVPTGSSVRIYSASEEITVRGRVADVDVATGSARVDLENVSGSLKLRYGRADVTVGVVGGSAVLTAGSGSVRIGEVGGDLDVRFGSADLEAGVIRGGLRSRGGTASTRVGAAYGNVDVALGSGPITLGVPAGVSANLDVTTGTGSFHSDLPVEGEATPGARTITIRARSGSGDVHLVRAAGAHAA